MYDRERSTRRGVCRKESERTADYSTTRQRPGFAALPGGENMREGRSDGGRGRGRDEGGEENLAMRKTKQPQASPRRTAPMCPASLDSPLDI